MSGRLKDIEERLKRVNFLKDKEIEIMFPKREPYSTKINLPDENMSEEDKINVYSNLISKDEELEVEKRSKFGLVVGTITGGVSMGLLGLILINPIAGAIGAVLGAGSGGVSAYWIPKIINNSSKFKYKAV